MAEKNFITDAFTCGWNDCKNIWNYAKTLAYKRSIKLLKYDNIISGKYKTNSDIGVPSVRHFDEEVKNISYMWREGGQFSTEKYNSEKTNRCKFKLKY